MNKKSPLENIVYISLPGDLNREIGGFSIDPEKMIPVELPPESGENISLEGLSWEMIISGMLKILAYQPSHEDADYYRKFILAAKPDIVTELSETGVIKARNKDFPVAEEIFLALNGLLPENPAMLINLALLYEQWADSCRETGNEPLKNKYEERAFDTYKLLFTGDEIPADGHINAAFFFSKIQNYEKALEHFEEYLKVGDDEEKLRSARKFADEIRSQALMDTLFKEAYDFIKTGKEEEGIGRIEQFLSRYPDVWNGWFLLGWGKRRTGQYADGEAAFEKALQLGPPQPDTLNELAICRMELGKYGESRKNLEAALSLEPENTKIISNLAILALKEEKNDEALGFFNTVLEIDPDDKLAKKYRELLTKKM
ncbi:MAG: tetratricopeptide repeat protein [Spirochaetia bacterium]